jgi:Arc/MetJ family transcription regulator
VDVDDDLLVAAQRALGTATKKDTINAALAAAAAVAARRRDLERLCAGGLPDLGDETVMSTAWE